MTLIRTLLLLIFTSSPIFAQGYDVFGIGLYDIKFDGSSSNEAADFRYERRFDKVLVDIGPEVDNFFYLKPFAGVEATSESAYYFIGGVYLDDNLGQLFIGEKSKYTFTPSFGAGFYDDGDGKKLGNSLQFRTSFEISYEIKNNNKIGISLSHISNANLGNKNPGAEIISLTYLIPY